MTTSASRLRYMYVYTVYTNNRSRGRMNVSVPQTPTIERTCLCTRLYTAVASKIHSFVRVRFCGTLEQPGTSSANIARCPDSNNRLITTSSTLGARPCPSIVENWAQGHLLNSSVRPSLLLIVTAHAFHVSRDEVSTAFARLLTSNCAHARHN